MAPSETEESPAEEAWPVPRRHAKLSRQQARPLGDRLQQGSADVWASEEEPEAKPPPAHGEGERRVRIKESAPKAADHCHGACSLPARLDLSVSGALATSWAEAKQQIADLADLVVSPLGRTGPLQLAAALEDRRKKQQDDVNRIDRLWEFRLCIDMLRDCLESYVRDGERDVLSTAEEALQVAEGLLQRVAELAFAHGSSEDALLDATLLGARKADPADAEVLLQVVRSPDFRAKGGLTHCLLASGLQISGLLEAVTGELTCWRSQPSKADLAAWKRWDRIFERLALRGSAASEARRLASDASWRCSKDTMVPLCLGQGHGTVIECFDGRPQVCAALCGPSRR